MEPKDYLRASNGSGEAVMAVVTTNRPIGSLTLITDSVLNWPHRGIATSGELDPDTGLIDPDTALVFKYHLDGSIITIDEFAPGYPDAGNEEDQVVVIKPNTYWADILAESIGEGGASVHIGNTPPPDPEEGDLWGDTSDDNLNSLVVAVGSMLMPIGHIIVSHNSANPATYYGFGTWVAITDRIIIGVGSDPDWNAPGDTYGEKDVTLTRAQLPAFKPEIRFGSSAGGDGTGLVYSSTLGNGTVFFQNNLGSGQAHNNMPPVIAKYIWQRTA